MKTANEILADLSVLRSKKADIEEQIQRKEADYERLQQSDILPIGTRVKLLKSWATEENYRKMSGWRAYLHFMTPDNTATIQQVGCYEGNVSYFLKFDDETCYYTSGEGTYEAKALFHFKREHFKVLENTHEIRSNTMQLKFKKLSPEAKLPEFKTKGAAGMDITTIDTYILAPLERKIFQTGLAVAIPEGYEIQVRPRSGLACREGLSVINTPGTIDSDYRGEIGVCLVNLTKNHYPVKAGDRIAQLVVNKVEQPEIIEVEELDETDRGDGGFGSTGK